MPLKHKVYWGAIVLAAVILMEIMSRPGSPSFLGDILESYQQDAGKMASIGGYEGYEYNSKQLQKDTLDYLVTIHGRTGRISISGKAVKKNDSWLMISQTADIIGKRE